MRIGHLGRVVAHATMYNAGCPGFESRSWFGPLYTLGVGSTQASWGHFEWFLWSEQQPVAELYERDFQGDV